MTHGPLGVAAAEPAVVFDFESGDFQGWQVVEGEFSKAISDREFYVNHPKQRYNKQGRYYLTTLELADGRTTAKQTGMTESPVFLLAGARISLLVGGGSHDNTYVTLCTGDGTEATMYQSAEINTHCFRGGGAMKLLHLPGFVPCQAHQEQLKRLAERRRALSTKQQIGDGHTALGEVR